MPNPRPTTKRDANRREIEQADEQRIKSGDLNSQTLSQGEYVTIFEKTATRSTFYAPGYGVRNRDMAEGFSDIDLQDSGTNNVTGELRFAVFASTDKDDLLYKVKLPSPSALDSATASNNTEKPVVHQRAPAASQDRVLALQVKVDNSTNDGNTISSSNSSEDLGLAYSSL